MAFNELPMKSFVVVSSPKQIVRKWRFVATNTHIVTGCLYSENGEFGPRSEVDSDAELLASRIAVNPHLPGPVWLIDICETVDGQYYLLEIGGFSFADLYTCNKSDVVSQFVVAARPSRH
jgi:hypothetical protein